MLYPHSLFIGFFMSSLLLTHPHPISHYEDRQVMRVSEYLNVIIIMAKTLNLVQTFDILCIFLIKYLDYNFVSLSRYGGIYLDSDIVVLKPLSSLHNSVGLEDQLAGSSLNGAVMAFRRHRYVGVQKASFLWPFIFCLGMALCYYNSWWPFFSLSENIMIDSILTNLYRVSMLLWRKTF